MVVMAGLMRAEQRARTNAVLLDATVECLVTYGYAGTTTQRIQDHAGVSRGALLHHFGSKSELLVAALHHIADIRMSEVHRVLDVMGSRPDALAQLVAALRQAMAGPPFQAALELWSAARTDPRLRKALLPAEHKLGTAVREIFDRHCGIVDPEAVDTAFESLMALMRGLELTRILRVDDSVADRVLDEWLANVARLREG